MDVLGYTSFDALTRPEAPAEREHGRGNSESDDISEGVQLDAKVAGGFRHAGDAAVQTVEYVSNADQDRCIIPVAPERRDYGLIPAEDISDGK